MRVPLRCTWRQLPPHPPFPRSRCHTPVALVAVVELVVASVVVVAVIILVLVEIVYQSCLPTEIAIGCRQRVLEVILVN